MFMTFIDNTLYAKLYRTGMLAGCIFVCLLKDLPNTTM